ncbi:collagen alpha-1(I) chain-like [Eublepharis macularius]|uniref:Collagen alpha-1(I) chain-like n=1 Tax=Eublepharis macularius TaxID=481883 RepID=A0AA97JPV4_EUBMA|nr:collagen alpha-1(I) chain-like [Eublepharis macularius]
MAETGGLLELGNPVRAPASFRPVLLDGDCGPSAFGSGSGWPRESGGESARGLPGTKRRLPLAPGPLFLPSGAPRRPPPPRAGAAPCEGPPGRRGQPAPSRPRSPSGSPEGLPEAPPLVCLGARRRRPALGPRRGGGTRLGSSAAPSAAPPLRSPRRSKGRPEAAALPGQRGRGRPPGPQSRLAGPKPPPPGRPGAKQGQP